MRSFTRMMITAAYLQKLYYYQNSKRTEDGLYWELKTHYLLYLFGHPRAIDGADMRERIEGDKNAIFFELLGWILP